MMREREEREERKGEEEILEKKILKRSCGGVRGGRGKR